MSISTLYTEKRSALAPPESQVTYETVIFNRERTGTNDLVERDVVDPTFRPPSATDTYQERVFQDGLNRNL